MAFFGRSSLCSFLHWARLRATRASYLPAKLPPYAAVAFEGRDATVLADARLTIPEWTRYFRPPPFESYNDPIPVFAFAHHGPDLAADDASA